MHTIFTHRHAHKQWQDIHTTDKATTTTAHWKLQDTPTSTIGTINNTQYIGPTHYKKLLFLTTLWMALRIKTYFIEHWCHQRDQSFGSTIRILPTIYRQNQSNHKKIEEKIEEMNFIFIRAGWQFATKKRNKNLNFKMKRYFILEERTTTLENVTLFYI
jgi:hypothetical protein